MSHVLTILRSSPNEWNCIKAILKVNGRPFLDLVAEIELPIATRNHEADLAGKYQYLAFDDIAYPSRQLLGQALRPLLQYHDKVSLLECDCGCEGCWPLLAKITVNESTVVWSDFEQPHRKNWNYPIEFRFEFDRSQYGRAIFETSN
jgi:hypothetical protein